MDAAGLPVYPVLFKMFARSDPDTAAEHIGDVKLTSNLFKSEFGDERLFFKHERYERDLRTLK